MSAHRRARHRVGLTTQQCRHKRTHPSYQHNARHWSMAGLHSRRCCVHNASPRTHRRINTKSFVRWRSRHTQRRLRTACCSKRPGWSRIRCQQRYLCSCRRNLPPGPHTSHHFYTEYWHTRRCFHHSSGHRTLARIRTRNCQRRQRRCCRVRTERCGSR